jgi:hypothetical protein
MVLKTQTWFFFWRRYSRENLYWGNILIKDDYNIQAEDQSSGLQQLGHSTPKQKQLRPKGLNKLRDNKKEGLNRSVQKGWAEQMGGEN